MVSWIKFPGSEAIPSSCLDLWEKCRPAEAIAKVGVVLERADQRSHRKSRSNFWRKMVRRLMKKEKEEGMEGYLYVLGARREDGVM